MRPIAHSAQELHEILRPTGEPFKAPPYYPIIHPRPRHRIAFQLLSDTVYWYRLHWFGRSVPCLPAPQRCPGCAAGWRPIAHGYICAVSGPQRRACIAPITEYAWRTCADLAHHQGSLRGRTLVLSRPGQDIRSPICAELSGERTDEGLPQEFDLARALAYLWSVRLEGERPANAAEPPVPDADDPLTAGLEPM